MKRIVSMISALVFVFNASAQHPSLALSTEKTTSLIFPFPIVHVDRGTSNVLAEQVKDVNNILLLKAAARDFCETNLSVVTGDGSLYSFRVAYEENPVKWVHWLPVQKGVTVKTTAGRLLDNPPIMKGIRQESGGITARVSGIYIHHNHLFFQLRVENHSPLDFEIDFVRFFIRDKKVGKRTAVQEIEYKPLFIAGNHTVVRSFSPGVMVVAMEKFTIPDAQCFVLQLGEAGGSRHLELKVENKKLLKATLLQDLP
jgi:hypothetical protein